MNEKRKNMNQEINELPDKESNSENESLSDEIVEVDASIDEETLTVDGEETVRKKASMSRKKKIVIISLSVFLGLILIIGGIGVGLFYHYYSKLNIEGRQEINVDERVIKLFDEQTGKRYKFAIDLLKLNDTDVVLVDAWYTTNKELVIPIGKDPGLMSENEKKDLIARIVEELRRLATPDNKVTEIKVYNTADGKEYTFTVVKDLIVNGADYTAIMEYIDFENKEMIQIFFEGDPASMENEDKTALFAQIAAEIRNMRKVRYPIVLKDAATGETKTFKIYEEELNEEQAKLVLAVTDELTLSDIPANPNGLDAEMRKDLIDRVIEAIVDLSIPRYTIRLRDTVSNEEYDFVIKSTEMTEAQLVMIVKQINRGMLDITLDGDPNLLDGTAKQQLIQDIIIAIDLLENPPKVYQISVKDRVSKKTYLLSFDENEVTDAQLVILLPKIDENATVTVALAKDPAAMTAEEKAALIAELVTEIQFPTRALLLIDSASGTNYTLYFRDSEVTAAQLSYLTKQIQSGNALSIAVGKDPALMTADEKAVLIEAIVAKMQAPPAKEYKFPIRDLGGIAYILKFTKEEVNDDAIFGYLLEQAQEGSTLEVSVAKDPANMTPEERKALFKVVADAIKNKKEHENDPELEEALKDHLEQMAKNPVKHNEDIYNVLLVGTDERGDDPSYARNSDTMILVTINYKDGTITQTSLMRDTHVEYTYMSGGVERKISGKLNSAFAVGGIKTLISVIEKHYGVIIDNYVRVNWFSFIDIFEVLGGIEVNVNANHLDKINATIKENCAILGGKYEDHKLAAGGKQHLDPMQTLAYVRYRVNDADFGRTQRQREALTIIFNKFKNSSLVKINDIITTVFPMLTTDLTEGNCAYLVWKLPAIAGYKMQQLRLPEWQEYTSIKGDLWPDWPKTVKRLLNLAYGSLCPEQYK